MIFTLKELTRFFFLFSCREKAKFEVFAIEESDDCKYDYLNVVFEATSPNAKPERYKQNKID